LPNVHELVSGVKRPADLRLPRREIVEAAGHRLVRARLSGIDPGARSIDLDDGTAIDFDCCLLAIGGVGNDYGVAGVGRHAMSFKSVAECAAIGRRLRELAARSRRFSAIVVGGGFEGLEALGEILRRYRTHEGIQIHVIERGDRLLPEGPRAVDEIVRAHLRDLPVQVHCSQQVAKVLPRGVDLASGQRIAGDITIWTGGAKAPDLVAAAGLPVSRRGWIEARGDLSVPGFPGVFAAGDVADILHPIAKQAYHAIDMGRHAATNIRRSLAGERTLAFEPSDKPMLIAFGDIDTFLVTESKVVASPALAAAKEAVFQATIAGFDRLGSASGMLRAGARGLHAIGELLVPKLSSWGEATRSLSVQIEKA
jgi:NADH dehydrogenase